MKGVILTFSSGDIISWGERIRLKHLPTKRYLAVIKDKEKWKVNTNTVEQ
jgi:hypothetical protein